MGWWLSSWLTLLFLCREREQASNFNTALYEHGQYLRRKKEAAEMRQAYESPASSSAEDAAPAFPRQDLSLKPGQTLKLKLSNVSLGFYIGTGFFLPDLVALPMSCARQ